MPRLSRLKGWRLRAALSQADLAELRLRPLLGKLPLGDIRPEHVQAIHTMIYDAGLAPQTARNTHHLLSRILGAAMRQQLIRSNPCSMLDAPSGAPGQGSALQQDELARLLRAIRGHRLEAGFLLAFGLGLRRSEILGLAWPAIDLNSNPGTLVVRQVMHRTSAGIVFQTPKTTRGYRTLALPPRVAASLHGRRKEQDLDQLRAGQGWRNLERDLVFTTHDGGPFEPSHFTQQLKALLRQVGAGDHRGHDLRHTLSSTLQSRGLSPLGAMGVLGHASPDMTMAVYGHMLDADRRAAAAIVGTYLDELEAV